MTKSLTFVRHLFTTPLVRGYGLRMDLLCPPPCRTCAAPLGLHLPWCLRHSPQPDASADLERGR